MLIGWTIILISAIVFIITLWTLNTDNQSNQIVIKPITNHDATKFKEIYPRVSDNNRFMLVNVKEITNMFEGGTGMIFLGFRECSWCQELAPIIDRAAQSERLEKIYYLDIHQARADNKDVYQKLVAKLSDNKDESPQIHVPYVITLRNGKIVGRFFQEENSDSNYTADTFWTSERRTRAITQLKAIIHSMQKPTLQEEIAAGAKLIDVRTPEEFAESHIKEALNIPLAQIEDEDFGDLDKTDRILLYCRSGNRSEMALDIMQKAGFINASDLGGIDDVAETGNEIID